MKAHLDIIRNLSSREHDGVVIKLVRRVLVTGANATGDYRALSNALTATGIPAVGTLLTGYPNLVLRDREMQPAAEDDNQAVYVDLYYEHSLNDGQSASAPPFGVILVESQCSLAQKTSNVDIDGEPIILQYTYPVDDPDYPGQTKIQGGEVNYLEPQPTRKISVLKQTLTPWLVEDTIAGAINDATFMGKRAATWMCSGVTSRPHSLQAPGAHYFTFELQYNADTWDPTAVFKDDRTKVPPPDLEQDVGYKTVRKLRRVNFESIIGSRVMGG